MHLREIGRLIFLGIIMLAVSVALIVFLEYFQRPAPPLPATTSEKVGPPSDEVAQYLEVNRGFDVLISYTPKGFEPKVIHIKKGDMVRFTNNAPNEAWLQEVGTANPKEQPNTKECNEQIFGECHPLAPRAFWEFAFHDKGTFEYINNLSVGPHSVSIIVE